VGKEEFGLHLSSQPSKFFPMPAIEREAQAAGTSHPKDLEILSRITTQKKIIPKHLIIIVTSCSKPTRFNCLIQLFNNVIWCQTGDGSKHVTPERA